MARPVVKKKVHNMEGSVHDMELTISNDEMWIWDCDISHEPASVIKDRLKPPNTQLIARIPLTDVESIIKKYKER